MEPSKFAYHDYLPANTEEARRSVKLSVPNLVNPPLTFVSLNVCLALFRLKVQHEVIRRTLGNVLIHVPLDMTAGNVAILESGTGSGIWLLDLARTIPANIELVGIDIESKLLPPDNLIPPNATFQVNSILDLPREWTGRFSLVHQRLLFAALTQEQWAKALSNMYRALKPGGWIQLFEGDKQSKSGPMMRQFAQLWSKMLELRGIQGIWPRGSKTYKRLVTDAGFVDIQVRWYETPIGKWAGQDGVDMRENFVGFMKAVRSLTIENGGFGIIRGGAEGYDRWMQNVVKEVDEGITEPQLRWMMICARKPSSIPSRTSPIVPNTSYTREIPPRPSRFLLGRVAIITGAGFRTSGIGNGRAASILFVEAGASVVCADLSPGACSSYSRHDCPRIRRNKAIAIQGDVSLENDRKEIVDAALSNFGCLDILVNNVGIGGPIGSAVDVDSEKWTRGLEGNCEYLQYSRDHRRFSLLLYSTSEGAIIKSNGSAARPRGHQGKQHVSRLGYLYTPMVYAVPMAEEVREARCNGSLLKTEGNGWDTGAAVRFLASDEQGGSQVWHSRLMQVRQPLLPEKESIYSSATL
ncbi:hypothetical protein NP233_g8294 [Leucocoprinus birnbaumii]|uniref:Methyltransferase domain-containing protein n=1 Tax=Leucocoprinus birnbaumii TaxID=56174 RepID=A0AAD5VT33_9AGAR|nr:hypothetical protein NP233_g8294 [Leucocoprinus birnbaumii]